MISHKETPKNIRLEGFFSIQNHAGINANNPKTHTTFKARERASGCL